MATNLRCCTDFLNAVRRQCLECVSKYVDDPEQHKITDRNGKNALHLAVNNLLILEQILPKMSPYINDLDYIDGSPLHYLLWTEQNETFLRRLELLILNGADVNTKDYRERNSLHLAARKCDLKIFKYLRLKNAESTRTLAGYNVLLTSALENHDIELFKYILENRVSLGVDPVNDETLNGKSLLHCLCGAGAGLEKMECLSQILNSNLNTSFGAGDLWYKFIHKNINKKDDLGRTPLMYLISKSYNTDPQDRHKDIKFLKMLLSLNADPLIEYENESCIEQAKYLGLNEFVEIMTEHQDLPS